MLYTFRDFYRDVILEHFEECKEDIVNRLSLDDVFQRFSSEEILQRLSLNERLKGLSPQDLEAYLQQLREQQSHN